MTWHDGYLVLTENSSGIKRYERQLPRSFSVPGPSAVGLTTLALYSHLYCTLKRQTRIRFNDLYTTSERLKHEIDTLHHKNTKLKQSCSRTLYPDMFSRGSSWRVRSQQQLISLRLCYWSCHRIIRLVIDDGSIEVAILYLSVRGSDAQSLYCMCVLLYWYLRVLLHLSTSHRNVALYGCS